MKVLFTALLSVLLVSTLVANEKIFTIGMPQDNMANDWRKAQVMAVKKELEKYKNIKFIYTDAKGNSSKQLLDAQELVQKGINLLIISPANTNAAKPVLEEIYKSGIPIVLLTRQIDSTMYNSFISPDDELIAKEALETIAQVSKNKANVVMLKGLETATTARKRERGFLKALKKYPDIKLVASEVANYSRAEAIKAMEKIINNNIKFDTIYAHSDSMAVGARMALEFHGYDLSKINIVGIDYIKEARSAIREKRQLATFTYPTCGKEGAQIAVDILNGKKVKKNITIPSQKVTIENIDKIPTVF